jgi:ribosome-associated protein
VGVRRAGENGGVDGDLEIGPGVVVPAAELTERFSRSSGPGGQSVNTSDTRVELRWDLAGSPSVPIEVKQRLLDRLAGRLTDGAVVIVASEHRSQLRNREAARARLSALVHDALAPPPPPRRPTRPSRPAREERLADKRRRAAVKRDRRPVEPDD